MLQNTHFLLYIKTKHTRVTHNSYPKKARNCNKTRFATKIAIQISRPTPKLLSSIYSEFCLINSKTQTVREAPLTYIAPVLMVLVKSVKWNSNQQISMLTIISGAKNAMNAWKQWMVHITMFCMRMLKLNLSIPINQIKKAIIWKWNMNLTIWSNWMLINKID